MSKQCNDQAAVVGGWTSLRHTCRRYFTSNEPSADLDPGQPASSRRLHVALPEPSPLPCMLTFRPMHLAFVRMKQ